MADDEEQYERRQSVYGQHGPLAILRVSLGTRLISAQSTRTDRIDGV